MVKKTSKQQQAKEQALKALEERRRKQDLITTATERAFIAQADLDEVRRNFAAALQDLTELGESGAWIRETFGLAPAELKHLLTLPMIEDTAEAPNIRMADNDTPERDEQHHDNGHHEN